MLKWTFLSIVTAIAVGYTINASVVININYLVDSAANASNCYPNLTNYCNLRSAWAACGSISGECEINLIEDSSSQWFAEFGSLVLASNYSVTVNGHNSVIYSNLYVNYDGYYSVNDNTDPRFLSFYSNNFSVPSLSMKDMELVGFGSATTNGGAMILSGNCNLQVFNINFTSCQGYRGGAININRNQNMTYINGCTFFSTKAYSGSLYIDKYNMNVNLYGLVFKGSIVSYGGGLSIRSYNSLVNISYCEFKSCRSTSFGGAVYISSGNKLITIDHVFINDCSAINGGGGIYVGSNAFISLSNAIISNTSSNNGGGIRFSGSSNVTIDDSSIFGCRAVIGGGIQFSDVSLVSMSNTSIYNCSVTVSGGGLSVYGGSQHLYLNSCNISYNIALIDGGGIQLQNCSDIELIESVLSGNSANNGGGLACAESTSFLTIVSSNFSGNSAHEMGGGFYFYESPQLQITNIEGLAEYYVLESSHPYQNSAGVIFSESVSLQGASGLLFKFDAQTSLYPSNLFQVYANSSKTDLLFTAYGDLWPGINLPSQMYEGSTLYVELTGSNVVNTGNYGFKMYIYPLFDVVSKPTIIESNTALKGGGIYMNYVEFPVILNSILRDNIALNSGGGIYFEYSNIGAYIQNVIFQDNIAITDGGAALLSLLNNGASFSQCTFLANYAAGNGGGLNIVTNNGGALPILSKGNEVSLNECFFSDNSANDGGGLYIDFQNTVNLLDCVFVSNIAVFDGGAVLVAESNIVQASGSWHGNTAERYGGGLSSEISNTVSLSDLLISDSVASYGGAVCLQDSTSMLTSNIVLTNNMAYLAGGAIASFESPLWCNYGDIDIERNTAGRGSAIFFYSVIPSGCALSSLYISDNMATVGGTVFWLYDDVMTQEPLGLRTSTVEWHNNIAPYGEKVATQAIQIRGPTDYNVTVYGQSLSPPLVFTLTDYYDSVVQVTGLTSIEATISNQVPTACNGIYPHLSGTDVAGVSVTDGQGSFSELEAYCYPSGNMTLIFTALLGDLEGIGESVAEAYYISNTTTLYFRECVMGEYLSNGQCLSCPSGSYNLETIFDSCTSCIAKVGVVTCFADELVLSSGYWRRYDYTTAVMSCPLPNGCVGGNGTGSALCANGYEGPLCGVCSVGYFQEESQCIECNNTQILTPTTVVFICIGLIVLLIGAMAIVVKFKFITIEEPSTENSQCTTEQKVEAKAESTLNSVQLLFLWLKMKYSQIEVKVKIVVSTLQVIMSVATVLAVKMPKTFYNFTNGLNFINLNFTTIFPISCSGSFTFIDMLVLCTLAPIVVAVILVCLFFAEYFIERSKIQSNAERRKGDKARAFNRIKDSYSTFLFYLSYLILPSVTTTIFQMFLCTNIDPNNETTGESNYYLTADLSISCSSNYYRSGVIYACIMILVYPIGIPALYMYLLYQIRQDLKNRNNLSTTGAIAEAVQNPIADSKENSINDGNDRMSTTSSISGEAVLPSHVVRLSFLWESYKPEYWYWEVVDTTRRLFLTAVLSVVSPGSPDQNVLSVLLALLFIKVYGYYNPYTESSDNILAEVGQVSIFFTFFGALIIQNALFTGEKAQALGILLVLVDVCVVFTSVYFVIEERRSDLRALGEELKKMMDQSAKGTEIVMPVFKRKPRRASVQTLALEKQYHSQQLAYLKEKASVTPFVSVGEWNDEDGVELQELEEEVVNRPSRVTVANDPDSDDEIA